ncbi:MAG: hypothetical protein ACP5RI_04105 [Candidatus Micrarchaeia archaeon]
MRTCSDCIIQPLHEIIVLFVLKVGASMITIIVPPRSSLLSYHSSIRERAVCAFLVEGLDFVCGEGGVVI